MSRFIVYHLRESPSALKYVALALIALTAILVVAVMLSHPNLR